MIRAQAPPAGAGMPASLPADAGHLTDASHFRGAAEGLLFPESEAEIARLLQESVRRKIPVTVSGAGTGLTGARVPQGGLLLCTERLNKILEVRADGTSVVQPGVPLEQLERALDQKGFLYPPDPGEKQAFVGGTVATNASGARSFKYGATRAWVRRLRVVLPNGDLLEVRRGDEKAGADGFWIQLSDGKRLRIPVPLRPMPAVKKNAAGYCAGPGTDLIDLFIGSEGTLGVFTEIENPPDGPMRTISSPINIDGVEKVRPRMAPAVGEHSVEILREIGYTEEAIAELQRQRVIMAVRA